METLTSVGQISPEASALISVHACTVALNKYAQGLPVIHSVNNVSQGFAARRCHGSVNITSSCCLQGLWLRKAYLADKHIISGLLSR